MKKVKRFIAVLAISAVMAVVGTVGGEALPPNTAEAAGPSDVTFPAIFGTQEVLDFRQHNRSERFYEEVLVSEEENNDVWPSSVVDYAEEAFWVFDGEGNFEYRPGNPDLIVEPIKGRYEQAGHALIFDQSVIVTETQNGSTTVDLLGRVDLSGQAPTLKMQLYITSTMFACVITGCEGVNLYWTYDIEATLKQVDSLPLPPPPPPLPQDCSFQLDWGSMENYFSISEVESGFVNEGEDFMVSALITITADYISTPPFLFEASAYDANGNSLAWSLVSIDSDPVVWNPGVSRRAHFTLPSSMCHDVTAVEITSPY